MPRQPRLFVEGTPAHLTLRGNDRNDVFLCEGDRLFFLHCLRREADRNGLAVHGYVLMTNHVHLLASASSPGGIGQAIQGLGRHYVPYFNKRWKRTGSLWERRYRSTLVDAESYLFACHRYIDMNPVRAGLVDAPGEYIWSSHRHYASGVADSIVRAHPLLLQSASNPEARQASYRALFDEPLSPAILGEIRHCTNQSWALGSAEFRRRLQRLSGRRVAFVGSGKRV